MMHVCLYWQSAIVVVCYSGVIIYDKVRAFICSFLRKITQKLVDRLGRNLLSKSVLALLRND